MKPASVLHISRKFKEMEIEICCVFQKWKYIGLNLQGTGRVGRVTALNSGASIHKRMQRLIVRIVITFL